MESFILLCAAIYIIAALLAMFENVSWYKILFWPLYILYRGIESFIVYITKVKQKIQNQSKQQP